MYVPIAPFSPSSPDIDTRLTQLLEEHFAQLRAEEGSDAAGLDDEDDEAAWEGWDVESDSSSDSDGWNDVSSDDGDIVISDSDDDRPKAKGKAAQTEGDMAGDDAPTPAATDVTTFSTLATTKVRSLYAMFNFLLTNTVIRF